MHILQLALTIRCHHGKETYTLFIDLIRFFNSINHELLLKLLSTYSIPKTLIDNIKKLYQNCNIQLQVNDEKITELHHRCTTSNNMVPILVLFIRQAANELIRRNLPPKPSNATISLIHHHMADSLVKIPPAKDPHSTSTLSSSLMMAHTSSQLAKTLNKHHK